MSPTFCVRSFTGAAVLLLLLPSVFGQRGGASPPPSTGGTPGGGNPTPGGNGPGVGRVPFPTANNPNGQYPGRPIFLSGRVMVEDGTPPSRPAAIERVCGTNRRTEGHTDSKGYFSIELGNPILESQQDASTDGFGTFGGALGNPAVSAPRRGGLLEEQLMNCELRVDLPGYQSQSFSLAMRKPMDDPNRHHIASPHR